jgi:hypothetical protein
LDRNGPACSSTWGVKLDRRGNFAHDATFMASEPGVFACGDMGCGQSLIVWATAEGRSCVAGVDAWLMGDEFVTMVHDLPSWVWQACAEWSTPEANAPTTWTAWLIS